MANQNDTASTCTKQCNSHLYDHLKLRFSQLEGAADLLTTSLHPDNKTVYKKYSQHDFSSLVEEMILEIKGLFMEIIRDKE